MAHAVCNNSDSIRSGPAKRKAALESPGGGDENYRLPSLAEKAAAAAAFA